MPNCGLPDLNLQRCTIQTGEALQSPGINVGAPDQGPGADYLQPPLRCGFRQQLRPGVRQQQMHDACTVVEGGMAMSTQPNAQPADPSALATTFNDMLTGLRKTQLLSVAAKLGIADLLHDGAK